MICYQPTSKIKMNSEQMMRNRLMERVLERNEHEPSSSRALQEVRASMQRMQAAAEAAQAAKDAKAAEERAASDRAFERLQKKVALKQSAHATLSLAKAAKTPEVMRAEAEKAISMYEEYKKYYIYRQPDIDAQVNRAGQIAALAQRELDKPLIQRWIEEHWELIITG